MAQVRWWRDGGDVRNATFILLLGFWFDAAARRCPQRRKKSAVTSVTAVTMLRCLRYARKEAARG
jgi:hypothetical protein